MQLPHMIPGVNIIDGKVRVARVNKACGSGGVLRPQWHFRRQSPPGKFLAAKWHLDWFKIDLNVAEITTIHGNTKSQAVSELSKGAEQTKKIFRL